MSLLTITRVLKFSALGCTLLAGAQLFKARLAPARRPVLFTVMDIAYLTSCVGTFVAFAAEAYCTGDTNMWQAFSTPEEYGDIIFIFVFCAVTVLLSAVFITARLSGGRVPGTICCIHGIIFTIVISDFLEATLAEYSDERSALSKMRRAVFREKGWDLSSDSALQEKDIETVAKHRQLCCKEAQNYSSKKAEALAYCSYFALGTFVTSGLAYTPRTKRRTKYKQRGGLDDCSPFSRVFVAVIMGHLKNTMLKGKVQPEDFPKLTRRLLCTRESEGLAVGLMSKAQRGASPFRFYCLLLRHAWKELFWSNALTLLYYVSLLLRIPVFYGFIGAPSRFAFIQSVLLLSASCIAEILVSSMQSYCISENQIRARHLIQSAVFRKVTRLSAAAIAANPAGQVSSLLSADTWVATTYTYYLPNAVMGVACVPIALAVLALQIGYVPVCACTVWLVVVGVATFSTEPLLDKYCNVFYKYRDERLKKFTDFLSVVRLVKMSALEDVFQRRLNQLRLKEIDQAYRVNILDGLLETLMGSSTSVMIILAIGTVTFMNPDDVFNPANIYSCVYTLALMEVFTYTLAHAIRLKSPVFRSCERLMSFFAEEEWLPAAPDDQVKSTLTVGEVAMKDCSFAWSARDRHVDCPVLTDVDLHLASGSTVGVVGPVGSGKSSLLSAIVGDMRCLGGSLAFKGRLAVVCQRPHVFNMTIRDNITFGRKYEKLYYQEVLKACQMARDIERFPGGDLAEAGEKGEMLSGGQRQRVALARAVYSRSDVYLLDDPTSSQDARVARGILEHVIGPHGLLGGKTRILVTNSTRLPFSVDKWVLMYDSRAVLFRELKELKEHPGALKDILEESDVTTAQRNTQSSRQDELHSAPKKEVVTVFKEEGTASSTGTLRIYAAYIKYSGANTVLALLCFVASAAFMAGQLVFIKDWSSLRTRKSQDMESSSRNVVLWLALACLGDVVFKLLAGILLARGTRQCSLSLHANMLARVAESPVSFFDATPRGRLLNRFSEDLEVNDSRMFVAYKQLFQSLLCVVGRLVVIATQSPIVFVLAFGAEVVLVVSMRYMIRASVISRLYESTRVSRIIQHLVETLDSVGVIRSYEVIEPFCSRFRRLVNDYMEAFNAFVLCYCFSRLLFTLGGVLVILLALTIVVVPSKGHSASAATVGLSVLSSFTVPFAMAGVFTVIFLATQGYVGLERALEYTELPVEEQVESRRLSSRAKPQGFSYRLFEEPFDDFWPSRGDVKFSHFSASYRPGVVDDALKDICFEAHAGEKVAVVGRTGAGKSSLVLALLRMIQRTWGVITIDGTDIYDVPLKKLRSAIGIIPQDPSLFCGTLRQNLDPPNKRSDEELCRVLRTVGLEDFAESGAGGLSFEISEKGGNLRFKAEACSSSTHHLSSRRMNSRSAGQRQLVSLARALLRATKILVLDEATSSMDPDTDRRIQATLRESFSNCTLITIAHRIETILDYDRVVVMADGTVQEFGPIPELLANPWSTFRSMVIGAGLLAG